MGPLNLSRIRPGDVVLIDGPSARGGEPAHNQHRFLAEVREVIPAAGGGELVVRRSPSHAAFPVRARLVLKHYREAGRPRLSRRRDEQREAALA